MKSSLSPKDVALAVGVSESSLKRWADDGKLHVTKTPGGHRRIQVYDALRFARDTQLPIQRPDILGMPELALIDPQLQRDEAIDETMYTLLSKGKAAEVRGVVMDMFLKGQTIAQICDGPIRSALYRLGQLWEHRQEGILTEHRATDICVQALRELRPLVDPTMRSHDRDTDSNGQSRIGTNGNRNKHSKPSIPTAVGSTPPDDPYRVTTLMVSLTVMEAGYEAVNLGPDFPYQLMIEAVKEHKATLAWISATAIDHAPDPDDLISLAEQLGPRVTLAVGGQALPPLPTLHPDNILVCKTLGELSAFLRGRQRN